MYNESHQSIHIFGEQLWNKEKYFSFTKNLFVKYFKSNLFELVMLVSEN